MKLKGSQRKYLRSLAHSYNPHIIVGKDKLSTGSLNSIMSCLEANELIKIKFIDKQFMIESKSVLGEKLECDIVGDIGKILIVYKKNYDKTENNIVIPD